MAISLKDIFQDTKKTFKLELLAGKEGLGNTISWVHLIEDVSTTDFIRGNELIITTGLGMNHEYWLDKFIEDLVHQHAVGLVVNVGMYIKTIPKHTLDYCNQHNFPLFIMPWEVHLVDIMQTYCNRIMGSEQTEMSESTLLLNAILSPENKDAYESSLKQLGYELNGSFCTLVIHPDKELLGKDRDIVLKSISIATRNIMNRYAVQFHILNYNQELYLILHNTSKERLVTYTKKLSSAFKKDYSTYQLKIGVGPIICGIENLNKSFHRCKAVFAINKIPMKEILFYDDIGVNKVLLAVDDPLVLRELYEETLGILEHYDKTHNSDYLETLRLYLEYNCSVQGVADHTFTHRNTVNYRIRKMKEMLHTNFDNMEDMFRYQLAFYIKNLIS